MILGIGIDLCNITRIENIMDNYNKRFLNRIYSIEEQKRADGKKAKRTCRYAQMFAAKEACAKALGTGLSEGVSWQDIQISSLPNGKPVINLIGGAEIKINSMIPDGMFAQIDISLSDESGLAQAMVIISARMDI